MKNKWINKIHCGDVLAVLKKIPDKFVDMVMTSPPYWGLRNYGSQPQIWDGDKNCKHNFTKYTTKLQHENRQNLDGGTIGNPEYRENLHGTGNSIAGFCSKCGAWRGELGLEPDFNLYIKHLCNIFDEVKRVLKDTGTIWINIGDTYWGGGQGGSDYGGKEIVPSSSHGHRAINPEYKNKSLCCIPDRFRIEMINRGWILRNKIEWFKRNCMPSSANDRFTIDFEDICFFVKSNKPQYWANERTFELVSKQPLGTKGIEGKDWEWREIGNKYSESNTKISVDDAENLSSPRARVYRRKKQKKVSLWSGHDYYFERQFEKAINPDGGTTQRAYTKEGLRSKSWGTKDMSGQEFRNMRCVWDITPTGFPEAHFATYPQELCVTPISAGCPEFVCKKCNKPKEKIYKTIGGTIGKSWHDHGNDIEQGQSQEGCSGIGRKKDSQGNEYKCESVGYAKCNCNAGFKPGIVLDPFAGAGTTCLTAKKLNRQYIGIEIKQEYKNMGDKRIHNEAGLL